MHVSETEALERKIKRLEDKLGKSQRHIKNLKKEVERNAKIVRTRNTQLDAMTWVWCNGGCRGELMVPDGRLTTEMLMMAKSNVVRMEAYFLNYLVRTRQRQQYVNTMRLLDPKNPHAEYLANDWWERHICKA